MAVGTSQILGYVGLCLLLNLSVLIGHLPYQLQRKSHGMLEKKLLLLLTTIAKRFVLVVYAGIFLTKYENNICLTRLLIRWPSRRGS